MTGNRRSWQWAACGKHPSLRDFFSIGTMFPLAVSFSEWLERGYSGLGNQRGGSHSFCSWRFWAKGGVAGELACGVARESSDSIGRPFPLLIIGIGPLEGWHAHWDVVPLVCEHVWAEMERFSVRQGSTLHDLEEALARLQGPRPEWRACAPGPPADEGNTGPIVPEEFGIFRREIMKLSENDVGHIYLDSYSFHDSMRNIKFVGGALKDSFGSPPSAVFIGGTGETICYAFFRRPLTVTDYSTLWLTLPQRQRMEQP